MRFRIWLLLVLLALLLGGGWYGVAYYRHRFVRSNTDLVKLLPPGDITIFFADLATIRQAGLLRLLAGVKPAPDREYEQFMRETQFDFARDLNGLAGAFDGTNVYLVGRGAFDWNKLQAYAMNHGGNCGHDYCQAPGTTAGKWANLLRVQPDVIALAVSSDQTAADSLRPPGRRLQSDIPAAPVWVRLSRALRTNPAMLPLPVQMFAISVQSAEETTLAVQPVKDGTLEIHLAADFPNAAAADTARAQLEIQTTRLKAALGKPDADSPAALLTGGSFRSVGRVLTGGWPVRKELLTLLE